LLPLQVKPMVDVAYGFCFYLSGDWLQRLGEDGACQGTTFKGIVSPIIILGPYWFRFMQCMRRYFDTGDRFPHVANAFK